MEKQFVNGWAVQGAARRWNEHTSGPRALLWSQGTFLDAPVARVSCWLSQLKAPSRSVK
jgi:hypothetical protein